MGTGYTRNDVSNNIADGNVINASDLDGEFDAIEAAFNASTGHTHDGTSAEGAPIVVIGPAQEWVVDGTSLRPKLDDTYDIGTSGAEVRNLWVDGTANIDALVADTADVNGGTVDGAVIGGTTPAAITGTTITATTGFVGPLTGPVTGTVTGNASTATLAAQATALATNRTFSITGDVTAAAVNFNGTGNVVLNATIDSDLAGIAALSWGNNEAPFYNAGAWQKYTVSGYSRSLLVAADAAAARTTLGATTTGNSLFTSADAAAGRTALGLGSMSTQAASAVNIDGGSIDGTVIGASAAQTASFTGITLANPVPFVSFHEIDAPVANNKTVMLQEGNVFQWQTVSDSGGFVATDFEARKSVIGGGVSNFLWRCGNNFSYNMQAGEHLWYIGGSPKARLTSSAFTEGGGGTDLGSTVNRWPNIFLVNAPNVSSDARLKENIADLTDAERRAASKIKTRTYTLKATGQKKVGYIAQEVIEAMASEGLDAFEYGLVTDGDTYGVDYDAINAFRLG